ncbi:nucleotide exchange factor GrpE [Actinomadura sp. HBU206391]|uniref:nucleotide exchange factor GrpE n=1 Tax=Actinomadura sp. HBU206391 TaxID=2731692 RepID=UPI002905D17C|nr:nucleotide exchange factor GrpE [Actinomadura sp. HBU206391]
MPSRIERLEALLAERTADLQRVKAEYDNYRKRVRRDRLAVGEAAVANVLRGLLPVLDGVARARELGEVHGGFQQVAQALETELAALGLHAFGEPGELFDPACHEALFHVRSTEVDHATCSTILAAGYRVGDHLLRPAQVTVTEPLALTSDHVKKDHFS